MRHSRFTAVLSIVLSFSVSCTDKKEPVDYVNPYMGTISILLQPAKPTIHLPNSIMRVYPAREDYAAECLNGLPVITVKHPAMRRHAARRKKVGVMQKSVTSALPVSRKPISLLLMGS